MPDHIQLKNHSKSMNSINDKQRKIKKKKEDSFIKHDFDDNNNGNISSTYDEDVIDNTDSDDYLSSEDEIFGAEIGVLNMEKNMKSFTKKNGGKRKSKSKSKSKEHKKKQSKPTRQRSNTAHFLGIPNGDKFIIHEADEHFDDGFDFDGSNNTLDLPKIPKMHLRSYSESNLQKNIQENQWPSTASSEESIDGDSTNNDVYSHYVAMKKKYKKQRRISKQFQDAIQ